MSVLNHVELQMEARGIAMSVSSSLLDSTPTVCNGLLLAPLPCTPSPLRAVVARPYLTFGDRSSSLLIHTSSPHIL